MACSVVLLDLDGTLVDSQPGILASCRAAIRSLGHEAADALDARALIGPPTHDVMRILLSPLDDHRIEEGVAAYREHYGRAGLFESRTYPGVGDVLAKLRAAGRRLFVATSKRTIFAEQLLRHLGLADSFESIHGSEPGGTLDEKDELMRHILALHGLAAEDCVMVGDRRSTSLGLTPTPFERSVLCGAMEHGTNWKELVPTSSPTAQKTCSDLDTARDRFSQGDVNLFRSAVCWRSARNRQVLTTAGSVYVRLLCPRSPKPIGSLRPG